MTNKQKELLIKLGETASELAEECSKDDKFHSVMIKNNDLYNMSLDEWALEWKAIASGER